MLHSSSFRKLVQISEEALPLIHVPIILGNDTYILTQQDIRKIEDTRRFSIKQVMPNGDLKPLNDQNAFVWWQQFQGQENAFLHQAYRDLLEYVNSKKNCYQEYQQNQHQNVPSYETGCPQPMDISTTPNENRNIASVEQQLQWSKCENTSAPFPLNYSCGTSTTEIDYKQEIKNQCILTCSYCKMYQKNERRKILRNKSTNAPELSSVLNQKSNELLDAREQLKKKKLKHSFI